MSDYRGRFAPSPTGPLHFGSLVAALGSFLQARARGGRWLVRMEDLDLPRNAPGAADAILRTLEAHRLLWDEEVAYQSTLTERYGAALERLTSQGLVYPCACTRKELGDSVIAVDGAAIYPGTCRGGLPPGRVARALRLRVHGDVSVADRIQPPLVQRLEQEVGDFVLRRADSVYAYQLAVVVDDAAQGITEVVRGADLFLSTPRQIFLQAALGLPRLGYAHLPLALDLRGGKLSKQTLADPLVDSRPVDNLIEALRFLGQSPPRRDDVRTPDELLAWAAPHWDMARVPRERGLTWRRGA